MGLYIIRT